MKRSVVKRVLIIIVCILGGIYGGDYLWLQLRLESKDPSAAMDNVTRYDATELKNGKVQIFFGQPVIQRCVHSLLPHLGYTPCWYLKRAGQEIKQISFLRNGADPDGSRGFSLAHGRRGTERFFVATLLRMTAR